MDINFRSDLDLGQMGRRYDEFDDGFFSEKESGFHSPEKLEYSETFGSTTDYLGLENFENLHDYGALWDEIKKPDVKFSRICGPTGQPLRLQSESSELSQSQYAMMNLDNICQSTNDDLVRLTEATGMPISQENGQRKYGPPVGSTSVPPKGSEVFVGKLPLDLNETHLVPVFEKVGRIYEIRLMMDFSGSNRGYCFVQFHIPAEASRAVKELNRFEIVPGRKIGVTKSVDNCRLFLGGIPKDKTQPQIFDEISRVTENVVNVISYPSIKDKSKNRGFAFVEYESHKDAAMARRKMLPGRIQLWGTDVAVDWAEAEAEVDTEVMNQVKALYVRNLLYSTTEETLLQIFNKLSDNGVEKLRKIKDYAFVHFVSRDIAEYVKQKMQRAEIDGAQVEVLWVKPVDKNTYQAQKAFSGSLFSPNQNFGLSGLVDQTVMMNVSNQPFNVNRQRMIRYPGYPLTDTAFLPNGTETAQRMPAEPSPHYYGSSRTSYGGEEFEKVYSTRDSSAQGGSNQNGLLQTLQPSNGDALSPIFMQQFQQMNFGEDYMNWGRPAGGVQAMRFPKPYQGYPGSATNQEFLPATRNSPFMTNGY